MKPLLRWAGSKLTMLPELQKQIHRQHRRLIEPFAGSGALFFAAEPKSALLADLNSELIGMMRAVRHDPIAVHRSLSRLKPTRNEYYRLRRQLPRSRSESFRAARFLFLNRLCYGGLYRTNLNGDFNVPFGGTKTGQLPNLPTLKACSLLLQRADLVVSDFEPLIRSEVQQGDFIFMDPPYLSSSRRLFREFGPDVFGDSDLERLADCLPHIERKGAHFILTLSDDVRSRGMFSGWRVTRLFTRRRLGQATGGASRAAELIITNDSPLLS